MLRATYQVTLDFTLSISSEIDMISLRYLACCQSWLIKLMENPMHTEGEVRACIFAYPSYTYPWIDGPLRTHWWIIEMNWQMDHWDELTDEAGVVWGDKSETADIFWPLNFFSWSCIWSCLVLRSSTARWYLISARMKSLAFCSLSSALMAASRVNSTTSILRSPCSYRSLPSSAIDCSTLTCSTAVNDV